MSGRYQPPFDAASARAQQQPAAWAPAADIDRHLQAPELRLRVAAC